MSKTDESQYTYEAMGEFTNTETERQDEVDNAIYSLVCDLAGIPENDEEKLPWNMEWIAEIREVLQEIIVEDLKLMTEMEFYPYRVLEEDSNVYNNGNS